jgi:hypothetical protein
MKIFKTLIPILGCILIFTSCQKELSVETGGTFGGQAVGSLKDTTGNCFPLAVRGTYKVDSAFTDSNYVLIQLNVTTPGNYKIVSDSINGFFFKDSGFISSTGLKTIKLKASGKPVSATQNIFTIGFGSGFCSFSVTTTAGSTGGGGGTTPPPVVIGDYFPITTNSNWTYNLNITSDTARFTVAATSSTIAGNQFRHFIVTSGPDRDTLLYRKAAGIYYEYGNIDFLGFLDTVYNNIEFIFLKDTEAVGGTWESAEVGAVANGATGTAKLKFTILQKNVTKAISGVSVDSVIVVKREIMFKPTGGTFSSFSTMNMNYAKNRGLLLIEGTLPPPLPALPYRFEATRYEIK